MFKSFSTDTRNAPLSATKPKSHLKLAVNDTDQSVGTVKPMLLPAGKRVHFRDSPGVIKNQTCQEPSTTSVLTPFQSGRFTFSYKL